MVIFKQKTAITVKFPSDIIVHQNEKGWMDNGLMGLWLSGYFVNLWKSKSLLVLDSLRVYISDVTKQPIRATGSVPAVIPGILIKLLQPLDISVN